MNPFQSAPISPKPVAPVAPALIYATASGCTESKALPFIAGASPSKITETSPVALLNALPPIAVTLLGMVMDVSPVASLNALPPIEVTVPGIIADPAQLESPLTAFL